MFDSISSPFNFTAGNLRNPWIRERNENQISVTLSCIAVLRKHFEDQKKLKRSRKMERALGSRLGLCGFKVYMLLFHNSALNGRPSAFCLSNSCVLLWKKPGRQILYTS